MLLSESHTKGRNTNDLGDIKQAVSSTDPKDHYEWFHSLKSESSYKT